MISEALQKKIDDRKNSEYEFLLQDRLQKIRQVINQYGEENFYLAFSGGKDSTVLHNLLDMAIPDNKIPRVYANTGIELNIIRDFVIELAKEDKRIVIIKPSVPIKPMLEKEGYPFKSKQHSVLVERYQKSGLLPSVKQYLGIRKDKKAWSRSCPKCLKFQFTSENHLKISDKCCFRLKEEPVCNWSNNNHKPYGIVGIMHDEGGRRTTANCLTFKGKKLKVFQPLVTITKEWENWFIEKYNIKICDIYKPPYNRERTGCKGCPFALHLQEELDTLEKFFPEERKQCEIIWKPVYDEYRRIGYRLKPVEQTQVPGQLEFDINGEIKEHKA